MKRKTINKLLAVAVSAALCIPITFADPISANASISADLPGTGDTDTDTDTDNGSGSVSGNRPSAPSTDSNSGSSASASGSVSSEAAVVNSASASTVVIGNSRVKSTVGGIFTATSVTGTAITTPKDVLASAVGLSDAEIKAGTNVRSYICDNRDKASFISGMSIILVRKDGVQVIISTPFARISSDRARGLWISSSFAIHTVMP